MRTNDEYIINMPPTGIGGSQTYAKLLTENLERFGFKVIPIKTYSVRFDGNIFSDLILKVFFIFLNLICLSSYLDNHKKIIVHLHLGDKFSFWENFIYSYLCMMKNKPYIIHVHTDVIYNEYSIATKIGKKIREVFFQNGRKIIVLSNNLFKHLLKLDIFPEKNATILHNCINIDKFNTIEKETARELCQLPTDKKILFCLGRLVKEKNYLTLINALKLLHTTQKDFLCIIGGSGPEEIKIKKKILESNLQRQVKLINEIPPEKVPFYMSASDIFVIPSLSEAFPMVILEALASGKPIVGANVGAIPEIISSEEYGYIIDPNDLNDISKKLAKALNTKWDKNKILRYSKRYSCEDSVETLINIYKGLFKNL